MKREGERIYECEVRRRRISVAGGYENFWKLKPVKEALVDGDTDFRCKDCSGAVKLFGRNVEHGPAPHAEHKLRTDSEYCPSGIYFRKATDGRVSRISTQPIV